MFLLVNSMSNKSCASPSASFRSHSRPGSKSRATSTAVPSAGLKKYPGTIGAASPKRRDTAHSAYSRTPHANPIRSALHMGWVSSRERRSPLAPTPAPGAEKKAAGGCPGRMLRENKNSINPVENWCLAPVFHRVRMRCRRGTPPDSDCGESTDLPDSSACNGTRAIASIGHAGTERQPRQRLPRPMGTPQTSGSSRWRKRIWGSRCRTFRRLPGSAHGHAEAEIRREDPGGTHIVLADNGNFKGISSNAVYGPVIVEKKYRIGSDALVKETGFDTEIQRQAKFDGRSYGVVARLIARLAG